MNIEQFRNYCIAKKGVTEHFPFDNVTLVFKIMNKMFALSNLNSWEQHKATVNLKCIPEKALKLRDEYSGINPGWHMNKKHWNTVSINNDVPDKMVFELIDHSYELIVKGLTKKLKEALKSI